MFAPSDALAKLGTDAYNAPGVIAQQLFWKGVNTTLTIGGQGFLLSLAPGPAGHAVHRYHARFGT